MKRLILAVLAATTLMGPVHAYDYWNGSGFSLDHHFHSPYDNMFGGGGGGARGGGARGGGGGGGGGGGEQPSARIIHRELDDDAATAEQIRKWEVFCKPTKSTDEVGIVHLHYAHKDCDVGRDE